MPGRILTVPYAYEATVRRPRKRSDEQAVYSGSVDVVIDEVDPDGAPVVFHGVASEYRGVPTHRFHEGRLWTAVLSGYDNDPSDARVHLGWEWLAGRTEVENAHSPYFPAGTERPGLASRAIDPATDTVNHVVATREGEVRQTMVDLARDVILIDGLLWTETPEPVFHLDRTMSGAYVRVEHRGELDRHDYRLDQADMLRELETSLWGERDGPIQVPEVVVLRPDLLRARTTERSIAACAKVLMKRLVDALPDGDVKLFADYASLRDGVRAMEAKASADEEADLEGMVDLLRNAMHHIEGIEGFGRGVAAALGEMAIRRINITIGAEEAIDAFRP